MDHSKAIQIFNEIRDRPYAWSFKKDVHANNCYFKSIELLQRLAILGYTVRGRVGTTDIPDQIPDHIKKLYPEAFLLTHFFVQIRLDNKWLILDPSFDPPLAKHGFIVNEFTSDRTCFDITYLYKLRAQITYQTCYQDPTYAAAYFDQIAPCAKALNAYLQDLRAS